MPPLGMALLVATRGDEGLPLGMLAWFGTGEARFGGAEGAPLAVARERGLVLVVLVVVTFTWVTVMSVVTGETTRQA